MKLKTYRVAATVSVREYFLVEAKNQAEAKRLVDDGEGDLIDTKGGDRTDIRVLEVIK